MIQIIIFILLWIASIVMTNGLVLNRWGRFAGYVVGFLISIMIGASIGN